MTLKDKVAVITGAGRGIGREIARRFAEEGALLMLVDIDESLAQVVAQEAEDHGGTARTCVADLSRVDDARRSIATAVAEYGRLDVLVNNAGTAGPRPLLEITPAEWHDMFELNVTGLFFCLQAAARQMIAQGGGGKIINMASISGKFGNTRHLHYAASKAAVISITYSAAVQLAPHRITVNALCPGIIDTPLWTKTDHAITTARGEAPGMEFARAIATVPLGRAGTPADVAGVASFLASPDSDYVTGQTINVDGGIRQD